MAPGPETLDAICGGAVQVLQPARGYRFSMDSVLLAHFAAEARGPRGAVMDLGTGSGVIPLLLARKFGWERLHGLELQPELFEIALRNVRLNRCDERISLMLGDLRQVRAHYPRASFEQVLANPPYFRHAWASPDPQRARARHEVCCRLEDVTSAVQWLLRDQGLFHVVFPAGRLDELLSALRTAGLMPRRLRLVHPRSASPAKIALVSAARGGRGGELEVLAPLVVHPPAGPGFTPEVQRMID